ncbi:hypothetical protein DVA67_002975 [Solirubrobacter sp. CPCC 204708]|uniref:DUF222 domain-containing protein n=1 Tax=Solirubrobacter deserti TaxID=2282478 RepID=A0ABT4RNL1_9ACTN|nr:hypothetical protein [Solirubrobacter deserti]MBE2314921.1 hypothetical protein [Solirubrobacter deserti]MDA0140152.1 hypothetical protein [Solirubrobacter deserti]
MRRTVRERPAERSESAVLSRAATSPQHQVLDLQRSAGNASVAAMLSRQAAPAAAATLPSAEELTSRIANCIGIWETNRGGDAPNPQESSLDTVAGVKASMATIEQATMPYALDALRRHVSLRNLAEPPLTREEIDAAILRVQAVPTLLTAITTAAAAGTSPDDFIRDRQAQITPTGLSDEHVRTMFSAVELKETIDTKHGELGKTKTAKQAAEEIPEGDRLGLGVGSLTSYIRTPRNWGENRAAWQRLAVNLMPGNVGERVNAVATSSGGTALAGPVVRGRVDAQLAQTPRPTEQQIVERVAQQNNPNETGYGANVWATYQRIY